MTTKFFLLRESEGLTESGRKAYVILHLTQNNSLIAQRRKTFVNQSMASLSSYNSLHVFVSEVSNEKMINRKKNEVEKMPVVKYKSH